MVAAGQQRGIGGQDRDQHVALIGFRAGQGEADREPVQGRDQVQSQTPEEPECEAQ